MEKGSLSSGRMLAPYPLLGKPVEPGNHVRPRRDPITRAETLALMQRSTSAPQCMYAFLTSFFSRALTDSCQNDPNVHSMNYDGTTGIKAHDVCAGVFLSVVYARTKTQ